MKKYILLLVVSSIFLGGCQKYLEELPKDRLASENFYKTKADAQAAVYAIYGPIKEYNCFGVLYLAQQECMSDYAIGRGSYIPVGQYQGLDNTNIGRVGDMWNLFYRSINIANIAIKQIPSIAMDESEKKALIAEAKFMRAYCYYHLVINWGAVPLHMEPVETADQEALPRTPVNDIYNAIVSDLESSENDLPAKQQQNGHPTKWSAKSFLALVYLTNQKWSQAKTKADEVIQSGAFSLVNVTKADDFDKIFGSSANGSSEEVFYLKFNSQKGSSWPFFLLWDKTQYASYGAYVLYSIPENPFIKNWNDNDLRKKFDIFSQYINRTTGLVETLPSSTPILYSKFRDPSAPTSNSFSNDYPFLRYADVLLMYAEAASQEANGPTTKAIEYLNMVKRRAYGFSVSQPSSVDYSVTGWTASSFLDAVLQERGYEFFMEGKRWLDLKRTGKAKEVILSAKGLTVKDQHLLWPIPTQEISTNPMITQSDQNPGY